MSYTSTQQLRHSLPQRSPSLRPRSLSLAEYAPLAMDRDALELEYHQSLGLLPSSKGSSRPSSNRLGSSRSGAATSYNSGTTSAGTFGAGSGAAPSYSATSADSSLGSRQGMMDDFPAPPATPPNWAGVGAGHSLSPPSSPFHETPVQRQTAVRSPVTRPNMLSPIPGSPQHPGPPAVPPRPTERYGALSPHRPDMRQEQSSIGNGSYPDEWESGERGRRKRRALPAIPTNVPAPARPGADRRPDYKSAIPPSLVAPSIENAYARLSAPPPNLPARRTQPARQASRDAYYYNAGPSSSRGPLTRPPARKRTSSALGRLGQLRLDSSHDGGSLGGGPADGAGPMRSRTVYAPPPAAEERILPSSNVTDEPEAQSPTDAIAPGNSGAPGAPPAAPSRPRPNPDTEVTLTAEGRTPIWSTHYFDPCLRSSLMTIPHPVSAAANAALSTVAAYPHERFNSTIGAPIDGIGKLAKSWLVRPDGKFTSEAGGIELGLAVIDRGGQEWGNQKGRKKARIDVASKSGGIKIDVIEIDGNRQIDLRVETKSGDVLILLPDTFHGPVHVTNPASAPTLLPILAPQCQPMANPYSAFHTTFVAPLALSRQPPPPPPDASAGVDGVPVGDGMARAASKKQSTGSSEHGLMRRLEKLPESLRGESDYLDMARAGYAAWGRAGESKISVHSTKGRVVLGYRESMDEDAARQLGLKVGAHEQGKGKKRWWRG